ncbi:unnamed protein product [Urochloa decumbens]|uniref:Uncharacterized protein n=2 Tax=Urochloa decumbens TaxID=240449 RepID=A0ABC9FIK0_9POAL
MVPNRDAMMIFAIIDVFLRSGDTVKRSPVLESFPQSFDYIPWRRVYKQLAEAQSATAAYPIMEHWDASELSFGGAGPFWCFTELQRSGENVSRKTEDGQTWVSKNGRAPKNGFPDQIRFDKLVISSKVFHMIELTLSQDKPTIALCKIWRKGNSEAASPQTPKPSVFSLGASAASLQVLENHFRIHEGLVQIDQPQGPVDGIAQQQHMPSHALPVESNIVVDFTKGCVSSIEPDEDSTYQNAVSFLDRMKGSFKQVAIYRKDEARRIASTVQNAASSLKNMFKSLGINSEPESTRPCTSNNTQEMEAASTAVNPAEIAPEMTAQDEFPDQLLVCSLENSFFDVEMFLNLDGGNGADVDQDEAM